jgi:hypothetical protein
MRIKFFPFLLGLCVFSAWGNISVTVNRSAKLFALPTEKSAPLSQVSGKSPLRAIEQSQDKKWVFVSDGLRYGWIRKEFVSKFEESKAVEAQRKPPKITRERVVSRDLRPRPNFSDDNDFPLDDEALDGGEMDGRSSSLRFAETIENNQGEVFVVRKSGALYDKPLRNADQFGKIESDDRVEFLNLSNDENWVKVRVLETGEEGWLPRKDISRKVARDQLDTLNRLSDRTTHLGVYGVFSPVPWSIGVLGTFSKTFYSLRIAETPLELGAGLGYSAGNTYSQFLTVSYIDMRGFLRWEPRVSPRLTVPLDLGLIYKRGIIRTTLSQSEFESAKTRIKLGETGMLFGAGVSYVPNDIFKLIVMPKLQVTSSLDLILDAGVIYSF